MRSSLLIPTNYIPYFKEYWGDKEIAWWNFKYCNSIMNLSLQDVQNIFKQFMNCFPFLTPSRIKIFENIIDAEWTWDSDDTYEVWFKKITESNPQMFFNFNPLSADFAYSLTTSQEAYSPIISGQDQDSKMQIIYGEFADNLTIKFSLLANVFEEYPYRDEKIIKLENYFYEYNKQLIHSSLTKLTTLTESTIISCGSNHPWKRFIVSESGIDNR